MSLNKGSGLNSWSDDEDSEFLSTSANKELVHTSTLEGSEEVEEEEVEHIFNNEKEEDEAIDISNWGNASGEEEKNDATNTSELAEEFERIKVDAAEERVVTESADLKKEEKFEPTYADLDAATQPRASRRKARIVKFSNNNDVDLETVSGTPSNALEILLSNNVAVSSDKKETAAKNSEFPIRLIPQETRSDMWTSGSWYSQRVENVIASVAFAISNAPVPQQMARVLSRSMCTALHDLSLESSDGLSPEIVKAVCCKKSSSSSIEQKMTMIVDSSAANGTVIPALVRSIYAASSPKNHPDIDVGVKIPHVDTYSHIAADRTKLNDMTLRISAVLNLSTVALAASNNVEECVTLDQSTYAFIKAIKDNNGRINVNSNNAKRHSRFDKL